MPDQPIPSPEHSKTNWRKSGVPALIAGMVALGVGVAFFLYGQMVAGAGANPDDPAQVMATRELVERFGHKFTKAGG